MSRTFQEFREHVPEAISRDMEDLVNYERDQLDEVRARARARMDRAYDQAHHTWRDADERVRENGEYARERAQDVAGRARHGARERVDDVTERARHGAEYARERVADTGEAVQRKVGELGERVRDTAEFARDKVGDTAGYARDTLGHVSDRVSHVADQARRGAEHTRDRLEEIGEHTRDRVGELTDKARAKVEDVKERVKETIGHGHQRADEAAKCAQDMMTAKQRQAAETWHSNTEAAAKLSEREYCLPLPIDRVCARHMLWVMPLLVLLAYALYVRRRNPDRWNAGMRKIKEKKDALEQRVLSARDQGAHVLQEESKHMEHHAKATRDHAMDELSKHTKKGQ